MIRVNTSAMQEPLNLLRSIAIIRRNSGRASGVADNPAGSSSWSAAAAGQAVPPASEEPSHQGALQPSHALAVLGARLAAAREAQGLSRAELAQRLHIGPEQLAALEVADLPQLPEQVFVIALARRLAQTLDLDVEEAIQALRRQPASSRSVREVQRPGDVRQRPNQRSNAPLNIPRRGGRRFVPLLVGLALAGLAIALGLAARQTANRLERSQPTATGAAAAPKSSQPSAVSSTLPSAPGQLLLSSPEPSWIAVRDRSGTILFQGLLSGAKSFALGSGLEVRAGRPDLVRATLPGSTPQRLGPIDRIVWYRFVPPGLPGEGGAPAAPHTSATAAEASKAPRP